MKLRLRTKQLIYAGGVGALAMLLLASGSAYWGYDTLLKAQADKNAEYEQKLKDTQKLLDQQKAAKTTVWLLKNDVNAGDEIKADNLYSKEVLKDTVPENVISKDYAIGKKTKLALKKDSQLTEPMLFQDGITPNDLRDLETKVITLQSNLKKDDFMDVRITFPTGVNYVLLAKKKVKDFAPGAVWFQADELEILTLSSAIVDAYINDATITAIKYSDPYMQEAAKVTYPPNEKVIDLIKSDPNIVKKATAELERRNRQKLESDLSSMDEISKSKYKQGMIGASAAVQSNTTTTTTAQSQKPAVPGAYPTDSLSQGTTRINTQIQTSQPQTSATATPQQQPVISAPMPSTPPTTEKTEDYQKSVFGADPNNSVPLNQ